jgi:hypothetical protein
VGRCAWSNRRTVEECRSLSIARLVREGVVAQPGFARGPRAPQRVAWSSGFEILAQYGGNTNGEGTLRLVYTLRGERVEDQIEITSIASPLGNGRRFYFKCPGMHGVCGDRVGKIYLAPVKELFRCRRCHDLTYRACKEHDKRLDAVRRLTPYELSSAMKSPDLNTRFLAYRAATHNLGLIRR